jgi:two-component system cell cycle response regulator
MVETATFASQLEPGVVKKNLNVLILDEDPEAALLLRRYLKASVWFEAELAQARTGKEGLALLESSNFDCVFLDHRLPDGDSTLWLEALSARYPLLPVILITSQSNETIAVEALKRGAWDYLAKSTLSSGILDSAIESGLKRRAHFRALEEQKQKLLEEERLKVLMQLAGATAHELSQPLTGLVGFCDLLRRDEGCPPHLRYAVDNILRSGQRIESILKQVRTIHNYDVAATQTTMESLSFDRDVRLLVVEDDDADFQNLKRLLETDANRLRVERACTRAEALRLTEVQAYDVLLADYDLPDGKGIEMVSLLVSAGRFVPCILVTGKGGESLAAEAFHNGFYDYLPKHELNRSVVLRSVWGALERSRMKREVEEATRRVSELAVRDTVTGLWNRRWLDERLEEEIQRSQRYGVPLALCLLDLDHFKEINDTYGHAVGDHVLKTAASIAKTSLRQTDFACRYGGEEFAMIFTSNTADAVAICCDRIRLKIESEAFEFRGHRFTVTASFGLVDHRGKTSAADLLESADNALYMAKTAGRNRIVIERDNGLSEWPDRVGRRCLDEANDFKPLGARAFVGC